MSDLVSYLQLPFTFFLIMSISAMSLQLTLGGAGLLSLGHAAFFTLGGYFSAIFSVFFAPAFSMTNPYLIFILACAVGLFFSGLCAALVAIPCLRLKGDYLAMATLGVGQIIQTLFQNIDELGGTGGFVGIPRLFDSMWPLVIATVAVFLFLHQLYKSPIGLAIKATRDDEIAARSLGIPIQKIKFFAFVTSASLASIGGCFYAHTLQFLSPTEAHFSNSITIVIAVVLGGLYSLPGSVLGALIVVVLPELLRFVPDLLEPILFSNYFHHFVSESTIYYIKAFSENRLLIFSALLVLLMLFQPRGLTALPIGFGKRSK